MSHRKSSRLSSTVCASPSSVHTAESSRQKRENEAPCSPFTYTVSRLSPAHHSNTSSPSGLPATWGDDNDHDSSAAKSDRELIHAEARKEVSASIRPISARS